MWFEPIQMVDTTAIEKFEESFDFRIPVEFREFLYEHNGAQASEIPFPTEKGIRNLTQILDFRVKQENRSDSASCAWDTNLRMRPILTRRRICFGKAGRHLICMERQRRDRKIVVWNHITQKFEPSELSVDEFIRTLTKGA